MSKIKGIAVFFALVNILSCVNSNAVQCLDNLTKIENVKPKNEISKNDAKKKKNFKDKFKFLGQKETYKKAWKNMKENKVPYISSAGLAFLLGAIVSRKTSKDGLDFISAEDFTFYTKPYQNDLVEHDDTLVGCIHAKKSTPEAVQKLESFLNPNSHPRMTKALDKMMASGLFRYFDYDSCFDYHLLTVLATILMYSSYLECFCHCGNKPLILKNDRKSFIAVYNMSHLEIKERRSFPYVAIYYDKTHEKVFVFPYVYDTNLKKYKDNPKFEDYYSCFEPKYYNEIDFKNKDSDGLPKISHFLCDGDKKVKVLSDEEIKQKKEKQSSLAKTV